MSEHSVSDAEARLSDLIDRALAGEPIFITRDGHPAVALTPVFEKVGRPMTEDDLAWIERRRVGSRMPAEDAGTLLSRMRDEGER